MAQRVQPVDQPTSTNLIRSDIFDNAHSKLQEVYDDLKAEVNIFQGERDNFIEISNKLKSVHFPSKIKLNVGGKIYETTLDTLKKDPDSMLAVMFSERFDLTEDENGAYFIDRDSKLFRHILNFLRTGNLLIRTDEIRDALLAEAEFFQIKGIINILNPPLPAVPIFKESNIMNYNFHNKIIKDEIGIHFIDWLPKEQFKWKVIYSGTKDGWSSGDFHRCCDGMSPTITLLKTDKNYIFGGYTDQPWSSDDGKWSLSKGNFVFSILNDNGISPMKFQANEQGGTYQHADNGPCFGGNLAIGYEICISHNPNTAHCSSELGMGYISSGQNISFLSGSTAFTLSALEIFSLDD